MSTHSHNRGWWVGPVAVSLACFTLVWQGWASSTAATPLIVRSNGQIRQFTMPRDEVGFQELCDTVVQQIPPKIHGDSGLVAWRSEIAAIYAAREKIKTASPAEADSVMRLASAGLPSGPQATAIAESVWSTYWQRQSQQASQWLDRRHTAHRQNLIAQAEAGFANRHRVGAPPAEVWVGGFWCAGLALIVSLGWISVQPVRCIGWHSNDSGDNAIEPTTISPAMMTPGLQALMFRPEWLHVAQPTGVIVRRTIGTALVLAAIVLTLSNLA